MRLGALAAAIVLGVGVAACGGDEAAPLTLEQRVPGAAGAPGSEPDRVETQVTVTGLDEFEAEMLADVPSAEREGCAADCHAESPDQVGDPGGAARRVRDRLRRRPFVYDIALSGPPEEVSEQEAEEIAKILYERVTGAPPPESG